MKLVTIIGARPQFIKAAAFSSVFRENNTEILIHTGQHYDNNMSNIFFDELMIPKPDYNLGIGSGNHGKQTGRMLEEIEKILIKEKPEGILVYGDTNSTIAGALAGSKLHIPVFHVEAGLRSYNKRMPEEQNRILTDHISCLLLCPTKTAVVNLNKEGIFSGVINTGDIMYDAVLKNIDISRKKYSNDGWNNELKKLNKRIPTMYKKEYYLSTIHRAENTEDLLKLKTIFKAFEDLGKPVLLPLHPRTKKLVNNMNIDFKNVIIVEPVGYLLMLYLIDNAYMVITDSGGIQKEAYYLKTPCTTLRDQTEWLETLNNQWNVLSQINYKDIISNASRKLTCFSFNQPMEFGSGDAAKLICKEIDNYKNR